MLQFTAGEISSLIHGVIDGNPEQKVSSFAKIEEAREGDLTFMAHLKYEQWFYQSKASVVIIKDDYELKGRVGSVLIRVKDPYAAFVTLLSRYNELKSGNLKGIEQPSFISSTATLETDVYIGAFAYISGQAHIGKNSKIHPHCFIGEGVQIGENCILHSGVKIYDSCILKNNVVVHAGSIIGGDGFGYTPLNDGTLKKVPQIGNVVIEEGVEIGCNTTIDRATIGSTVIDAGVKLDNLIQVGHNVSIGKNTVMAAQVGIAGSTKIGNGVSVGGQAGFADHIEIADGVKVGGGAGVTRSIKEPKTAVNDTPAFEYMKTLRSQSIYRQLPELEKRLSELEKLQKDKL